MEKKIDKIGSSDNNFNEAKSSAAPPSSPDERKLDPSIQLLPVDPKPAEPVAKLSTAPENSAYKKKLSDGNLLKTIKKPAVIWSFSGVILLGIMIGGTVWGLSIYDRFYKKIPVEKILPKDAELVAKITVDPGSLQFQYLESNMEKFPGYDILKKRIDKKGEGKTVSQAIQDKIKEVNLDFEEDLKPAIGDKAYLIIPDISPLGKTLRHSVFTALKGGSGAIRDIAKLPEQLSGKALAESGQSSGQLAADSFQESSDPRVLGEAVINDNQPLDFIISSEIKDMKKAEAVIEKIRKDSKYETEEIKYLDNKYYKLKFKGEGTSDDENGIGKYINCRETYNAMVGGNWIMTSSDGYMRDIMDKYQEYGTLKSIRSKNFPESLESNENFTNIYSSLDEDHMDSLATIYYNIDYAKFFRSDCGSKASCDEERLTEYFKYPERITSGFMVRTQTDGIVIRSASNKMSVDETGNRPISSSLATKVPESAANRWTDMFFEYNGVKDLYYNFKKNNLTDEGYKDWNETLKSIREDVGIDFEKDFIDLIDGNIAFVLFSKKGLAPSVAMIAEVDESDKMLGTMKKIVESIKADEISNYQDMISYYEKYPYDGVRSQAITGQQGSSSAQKIKKYQDLISAISNSAITETNLPEGKIYNYTLPKSPDDEVFDMSFSINFCLGNGQFIIGADRETTEALMKEFKNNTVKKLSETDNFKKGSTFYHSGNYSDVFINTIGIWNTAEYVLNSIFNAAGNMMDSYCGTDAEAEAECAQERSRMEEEKRKLNDKLFAAGAVIRTLKLVGVSNASGGSFLKSSYFFVIDELPKEEKDRASRILEDMEKELSASSHKADVAAFKSSLSSLVPALIIACDSKSLTVTDFDTTYNQDREYYDPNQAFSTLIQECGPRSSGKFQFTAYGVGKYQGITATCSEFGCKFNN